MDNRTKAFFALAAICIIWGTTYTAIKVAVQDFPPFMMVGLRQTSAGLLLLIWAYATGKTTWKPADNDAPTAVSPLTTRYVLLQGLTGLATITGGNGFITWGMQYVSSGLSSVIGSLTPVLVVIINLLWRGTEKINWVIISGVLLGFCGLGVIFNDGWADFAKPAYRLGILGCFASCFTWSLGTVMSKRFNNAAVSPILNAGLQITAGGLGGWVLSALLDKSHVIHHTVQGWSAIIYLIVVGSAIAFSLYMFVLKHLSATQSSLYTYINPLVAITLGWLVLGEDITRMEAAGMVVTICGVYVVNRGYNRA